MLHLYNEGIIPKILGEEKNEKLKNYYQECSSAIEEFQKKMDQYELTNAFNRVQILLNSSNKLISDLTPWKLAKKGDRTLLCATLNYLSNGIKIIAFLLNFIIPKTSEMIYEVFNLELKNLNWDNLLNFNSLNNIKTKALDKHLYKSL
jgi:methionyl-tRNA synthetase